jgi:hypothetical protein
VDPGEAAFFDRVRHESSTDGIPAKGRVVPRSVLPTQFCKWLDRALRDQRPFEFSKDGPDLGHRTPVGVTRSRHGTDNRGASGARCSVWGVPVSGSSTSCSYPGPEFVPQSKGVLAMPTRIWRTPRARALLAIDLVLLLTGLTLAVNGAGQPTQASKTMSLAEFSHHHRGGGGGSTTTTSPPTTTSSTTTTQPPSSTTTTTPSTTTTTSTSTSTTTTPSSSVAFVQADDTGTINGNTTSIGSGQSNQVLAHDTGIGHSVVLMIQTLTYPGTETDTVTSVSSAMGTFHFVNSYNDEADFEIWVCTDTTGAADTVTVNTPTTNAWDAFAVEFNAPATGFVNGGGQVVDLPYQGDQSWTVSPGAAGNLAVIGVDTADAYDTGPAAPWTYYNSGYWSFFNGTSAAWQVAPSSSPLTATWVQAGGESSSQGVVLEY